MIMEAENPMICNCEAGVQAEPMAQFQFEPESKGRRKPVSQLEDHKVKRINSHLLCFLLLRFYSGPRPIG